MCNLVGYFGAGEFDRIKLGQEFWKYACHSNIIFNGNIPKYTSRVRR
jgi:hypothetical protein